MPNPTPGDVHVDAPLSNISEAYIQDATHFIATRMFPNVSVQFQSDLYFTYDRQDFFRSSAEKRAPGSESAGSDHKISTEPYRADVYALHRDIDDQVRANQQTPIDMDRDASIWLTQQMLLRRENDFVNQFFQPSIWTGSTTGNDQVGVPAGPVADQFLQWNDAASTPIEDLRAQIVGVAEKTGFRPNKLTIGPEVWSALVDHPDILDRIKYTQAGVVTTELIASLLDLDEVMVGWAVQDLAPEGAAANYQFFWGKNALLTWSPASAGILIPSAGYTFSWTGLFGAGAMGSRISSFRIDARKSDRIEGEMAYALKQVSADLGVFFQNAVA